MSDKLDGREEPVAEEKQAPIVLESMNDSELDGMGLGDRIYLVALFDPLFRRKMVGATIVTIDTVRAAERVAFEEGKSFESMLASMAYTQVAVQLWGGPPPPHSEVIGVREISRSEFIRMGILEREGREEAVQSYS